MDVKVGEQYDNVVVKLGALADYTIAGKLYARAGLLLDFGLAHKDTDPKDDTFGVTIPLGIGYRL